MTQAAVASHESKHYKEMLRENRAIRDIQEKYFSKDPDKIYWVGEDLELRWKESEISVAEEMWVQGFGLKKIGEVFNREEIEVLFMLTYRKWERNKNKKASRKKKK